MVQCKQAKIASVKGNRREGGKDEKESIVAFGKSVPDVRHDSKTEHDFCPGGGGTVNQYSETEVGGLTLSDWDYTETSDKITLTKYKGDQVNVVIPSEFEGHEGKTVEIKTFDRMFENLMQPHPDFPEFSDWILSNKLTSLKVGTTDKKVKMGTESLDSAFYYADNDIQCEFINLFSVDLSGLDTKNMISMDGLFLECHNLETVDLTGLDTSRISYMKRLFDGCYNLKTIKGLDSLDMSNVEETNFMFSHQVSLQGTTRRP